MRPKAAQPLGFLITCFEEKAFDEEASEVWQSLGERFLKGDKKGKESHPLCFLYFWKIFT